MPNLSPQPDPDYYDQSFELHPFEDISIGVDDDEFEEIPNLMVVDIRNQQRIDLIRARKSLNKLTLHFLILFTINTSAHYCLPLLSTCLIQPYCANLSALLFFFVFCLTVLLPIATRKISTVCQVTLPFALGFILAGTLHNYEAFRVPTLFCLALGLIISSTLLLLCLILEWRSRLSNPIPILRLWPMMT